jgi:phytoene dehydrogenase-like protein
MSHGNKVCVVGAGVAGLVAAIELEKAGKSVTIFEATDRVGGRVKTDYIDGYQFDHGFQVLLTAYPEVSRYLDKEALKLNYFKPGAITYAGDQTFRTVDPLRQPSAILSAIFSPVGSLRDKWLIWRLSVRLKQLTIEEIFTGPSISTMEYLGRWGFSKRIISNFFQPFFSGIFLENKLETSSRMFQFIFKMFSEGYAAIPEKGMQAIPNQLISQLRKGKIHFNARVEGIADGTITTSEGDFDFDAVVIATEPGNILTDYKIPQKDFESTINLYFNIPAQNSNGYIGLLPNGSSIVNNISILSDVSASYAPEGQSLLSASVVGTPLLTEELLLREVRKELSFFLGLNLEDIRFLKSYFIPHALPKLEAPTMDLGRKQIDLGDGIYLAGDYLLGGSLNGAMVSGRRCAEVILADLKNV